MSTSIAFKARLREELRRFSLNVPFDLPALVAQVARVFQLDVGRVNLTYLDEDNDFITLSNNEDLRELLRLHGESPQAVRLFVNRKAAAEPKQEEFKQEDFQAAMAHAVKLLSPFADVAVHFAPPTFHGSDWCSVTDVVKCRSPEPVSSR
mmetsp:Transcript_21466/g.50829  ORF Transcript_21466/g.50829 Transcript_21466/m.50829 type:complete len:150 (-) Transcript_21466:234-683(-)